jgi:hypothetical protein
MKKPIFTLILSFFAMFLFLRFSLPVTEGTVKNVTRTAKFAIPEDIQPIVKKSCWGCHNTQSKNEKAKAKLSFDTLEKMKKKELGGVLSKINEEVSKGDMPPPMFLEKFAQAKPTDEEKGKLISWSQMESSKYMKKKKNKEKEASM